MNRRTQRVSNLIRGTLAELVMTKVSDPRVDPARTSVTRVEMPDDLLTAKVFVSVLDEEPAQRRTLRALQHASGRLQELMMRKISLRNTPVLRFVLDKGFKRTIETLRLIDQVRAELNARDAARGERRFQGIKLRGLVPWEL